MAALTKQKIIIIGPRKLQNELLAYFLERETGATCLTAPDITSILCNEENSGNQNPKLIFWDCFENDVDTFLEETHNSVKNILTQNLLVFFNVNPGQGIEERSVMFGIKGCFYEQDSLSHISKGIQSILQGELWISREIMTKCILANQTHNSNLKKITPVLTQREIEILTMIAGGTTNEEIAEKLCISSHTVKTHIYNIFKKINVPNRLQAALWAAKHL